MANKSSSRSSSTSSASSADTAIEQKVVQFAEQLGRMVGTVQARADGWLDRKTLKSQIASVRDAAADLLDHVTGEKPATRSKGKARPKAEKRAAATKTRELVDAPGKRHRKPAPSAHGVKHSDERIAKLRLAKANRQRRSGG